MSSFETDLSNSTRWFKEIVWPEISEWYLYNSADLIPAEGYDNKLHDSFDTVAGIDFWVVESNRGMFSIASRVQTYDKTTFTVRYSRSSGNDTEYQKRVQQLESNYELPTYTVQAYIDPTLEVLRNVASVRTDEFYEYLKRGKPDKDWPLIPSNESEMFFPVEWRELDSVMDLNVYDRERANLEHRKPKNENLQSWV